MKVSEVLGTARDVVTVKRVYGEPYRKDGLTVIPAALVGGGGGGGTGHDKKGQTGEGGGFGMSGRPAGAFVIKDGHVSWRPAVAPTRMLSKAAILLLPFVMIRPRVARARARWAADARAAVGDSEH
jgi:uncharacterized spore protein YtfJ